jgi:hypothetical protein
MLNFELYALRFELWAPIVNTPEIKAQSTKFKKANPPVKLQARGVILHAETGV